MATNSPSKDCTSLWKWPMEHDGWYRAHNALRADFEAIERTLGNFQGQLAGGKPISREQAGAATRFVDCFINFLHHHHHNEDDIAVPYMATRCEMPEKLGADHKRLEELMDAFHSACKKLLATTELEEQRTLLPGVMDVFGQLSTLCLAHFKLEEEQAMPLMRKHFTPHEIEKHVVSKILRSMGPNDVGSFFRTMDKEDFRGFAKQEGIPFFICWLLNWQRRGYSRKIWQPFEQQCLSAAA